MKSNQTFVIAEAGVNHNGSLALAKKLIDVAKEAQADAVKFQTFRAEDLVCRSAPKAAYQKKYTVADESQYQMLKLLELSETDQAELYEYCQRKAIQFLSSPFDSGSANFLSQKLNLPLLKIASGEITNLPMLFEIAKTGKSVILSTGMSTLGEIETALGVLAFGYLSPHKNISLLECEKAYCSREGQDILQQNVSLLHCTTDYPAAFEEVNLRVLQTLRHAFNLSVGYSDHTIGIHVSIAAVALGATIIEKHFTLDKALPGPDHQASLEPMELTAMVAGIRQVEKALGSNRKTPTISEFNNRLIARKSLVALDTIPPGGTFTEKNLGCKRPGNGMAPARYWDLQGSNAQRHYEKDEVIEL